MPSFTYKIKRNAQNTEGSIFCNSFIFNQSHLDFLINFIYFFNNFKENKNEEKQFFKPYFGSV